MNVDDEIAPTLTVQPGVNPSDVSQQDSDRVSDDSGDDDEVEAFITNFPEVEEDGFQSDVPVIYPRQSYSGALNIRTIKDGQHGFLLSLVF